MELIFDNMWRCVKLFVKHTHTHELFSCVVTNTSQLQNNLPEIVHQNNHPEGDTAPVEKRWANHLTGKFLCVIKFWHACEEINNDFKSLENFCTLHLDRVSVAV